MCIYAHTGIYNPLSSFSLACMYMCPGLTTWNGTAYAEACPWRKLIPLQQPLLLVALHLDPGPFRIFHIGILIDRLVLFSVPGFPVRILEIEFNSSCFRGKYCTDWAVSTVLLSIFLDDGLRNNFLLKNCKQPVDNLLNLVYPMRHSNLFICFTSVCRST